MASDKQQILNKINEFIKKNLDSTTQSRIKALLSNNVSKDTLAYILEQIENKKFTSENLEEKILEIKKQKINPSQTGENKMDNQENDTELTQEERDWYKNREEWKNKSISEIKEGYKKYLEEQKNNQEEIKPTTATLDESDTPPENTEEEKLYDANDWRTPVSDKYKDIYGDNANAEYTEKGLHIDIASHDGFTGSSIHYESPDHLKIHTTQDGTAPKDQSYKHFCDHIEVLKSRGFKEIALGDTQNPEFRTKLICAVLEKKDMAITNVEQGLEVDLSAETLKDITPKVQTDFLKLALEQGAKIKFGKNSPLLDFNNEAIQGLDEKEKYQLLAIALRDPDNKDKIQNMPKIELYEKDENGKIKVKKLAIQINYKEENKQIKDKYTKYTKIRNPAIPKKDEDVLLPIARQQKIADIRNKTRNNTEKPQDKSKKEQTTTNTYSPNTGHTR